MSAEKQTAEPKTVRTTVSVPCADYEEIELLAKQKKVSIAWIIREAIDKYLTAHNPLFRESRT